MLVHFVLIHVCCMAELPWHQIFSMTNGVKEKEVSTDADAFDRFTALTVAGVVLCVCPANERRRYNVTSSLSGWAHAQNDPLLGMDLHCELPFLISNKLFNGFQSIIIYWKSSETSDSYTCKLKVELLWILEAQYNATH